MIRGQSIMTGASILPATSYFKFTSGSTSGINLPGQDNKVILLGF
jgi:hypothetical protein